MSKYQIIVESDQFLADDQFANILASAEIVELLSGEGFKVLYVNNLQGIRKELWKKKESYKDYDDPIPEITEETFKLTEDLFKIGD